MEVFVPILKTVGYIAVCVFAFSLSIAIHEFGHFIVALKLGYRVERFSIGFGPAIWKKVWRGVEYRLSWIPLGGYVSIPEVDPEGTKALEGASGEPADGNHAKKAPPWKDLLVALAGPAMNVVLAFVLAFVLYFAPDAKFGTIPAKVAYVAPDGPAGRGGMLPGDEIVSVGGRSVANWGDMRTEVQFAAGRETEFVVRRGEGEVSLRITPEVSDGISYIAALSETNENAACAMWMTDRNPLKQVAWDAGAVFRALKGLVTPREMKATGKAIGGPVLIAKGTYSTIRRDTWDGIGFLRFINTNLAVMNLLPIPVLDGGLILFSLIAIIIRRRIPEKIMAPVTTFFMYLLVALMLFLVGRDFWKIGQMSSAAKSADSASSAIVQPDSGETEGGGASGHAE